MRGIEMVQSRFTSIARLAGVAGTVVFVALALAASSASASSAWWHLTRGVRPVSLGAGSSRDEVQEITTAAESAFILKVDGRQVGAFEVEPYPYGAIPHA